MAKEFAGDTEWHGFLAVVEYCPNFSFSGRGRGQLEGDPFIMKEGFEGCRVEALQIGFEAGSG